MTNLDIFSYIANIIFVTWGVSEILSTRKLRLMDANSLNATYEMAERLANKLSGPLADEAKDIASNIKSLIMSCNGELRNEIAKKGGGKNGKI